MGVTPSPSRGTLHRENSRGAGAIEPPEVAEAGDGVKIIPDRSEVFSKMWRCTKCNFLHMSNESPKRCDVCRGEGFIQVLIRDARNTGGRPHQGPGAKGRAA